MLTALEPSVAVQELTYALADKDNISERFILRKDAPGIDTTGIMVDKVVTLLLAWLHFLKKLHNVAENV